MTGSLNFSLSDPLVVALFLAVLQPLSLWVSTKLPFLKNRNPLQFLVGTLLILLIYVLYLIFDAENVTIEEIIIGAMLLICGNLLLLEMWALLSRGYTLGLLLTLLKADKYELTIEELASQYRGGEGVDWIMRHRLSGLIAAGLVVADGKNLSLTKFKGKSVVWLYLLAIMLLGLKRTG